MKIQITKNQKIQLLKSIQSGVLDTAIVFPDLYNYEPARTLTKEEAKELWNNLDEGNFETVRKEMR